MDYDLRNGQQVDLLDNSVWGPLRAAVVERDYAVGFACPDGATFSKLHSFPVQSPCVTQRAGAGMDEET